MAEVIVGIDLGTSNCVVAHCDEAGQVHTLADEAGYKIHPSVVSFLPSGGVVVGAEAKQRKVIDPQNTIYSAKRLIGRSFRSPEVQMAKARMPYQIREGANQLPLISTRAGEFAIPEISAVMLDYVRNLAARALGAEVNQAVITVPANFNDAQRTATATAGAIAGITVMRVLNEPTAAALAYGHTRQLRQTIAVYDFGGGTFDITILKLDDQVYEVLGTAGDSFLGGDDLDERLVDRMVERFLAEQRIDLRSNEVAMMRLRAVAEQTKIELSRRNRAVVRIDEIAYGAKGVPLNLQIEITRDEFVAMISDIILRTFPVCQEALKVAGLGIDGIEDIVLVGGTTKIPAVRDQVAKFFARAPRNDINPEEAVAVGAALQADSLQRMLAKSAPKPSVTAPAAAYDDRDGEETAQSAAPEPPAGSLGGRAKRETADIGSRARSFSERPMTRGLAVDRFDAREETTGVALARMEAGRAQSATLRGHLGTETGDGDDTRGGDTRGGATRGGATREVTSTRRSYRSPDEEESTATRPAIDPHQEDTSTGAPVEVLHESTRSSMNPVSTGRRPAAPAAPPLAPVAPVTAPLAPVAAAPPPRAATVPPPPPQRMSRPRIPAQGGTPPKRDSLPAIDPLPEDPLPVSARPTARPSERHLGEEPSSAASTAQGMTFPADPQVTARGLVPELPISLAGQPMPSTTARGVAPPATTMMIGTGLASAGSAAPLGPSPGPGFGGSSMPAGPPPSAGPQARTMIAQTPEAALPLDFPHPAPFAGGGGGFGPRLDFGPPMPVSEQRFPPPGVPPRSHYPDAGPPPPSQPGFGPGGPGFSPGGPGFGPGGPGSGPGGPGFGPGGPGFGAGGPGSGPGGPGFGPGGPGFAGPPPGGFAPPAPAAAPDPRAGAGVDAFAALPYAPSGSSLPTPMPFAAPLMPRPGQESPFLPPPQMAAAAAMPTMAAMAAMPVRAPVVLDVTPFGLGIVTVAGYCEELVRRNSRVPTEMRKLFSTSRDNQDVVRIVVCQGEARRIEGNVVIGELVLADLPPKPRGETSIEVAFAIDASGILHVRARDATSGREQRASLNVIGTIPEGDVAASRDRMQQLRR